MTDTERVLANGGEAGALARSIDWSRTALGPVERWSQALRSTVALILHNHSGLLLWWGPEFIQIYNDAYRPVLADKHPRSMGQPVSECWSEIWHIIGPMIEAPFRGGPASVSDDLLLPVRRKQFVEETHFRVAYSPVPDETVPGTGIGGVLATVTETTEQMYAERQLRTLRELGARGAAEATTVEAACTAAAATLADDPWDVPFALFYLLDDAGARARRVANVGFDDAGLALAAPAEVELAADPCAWPLRQVAADRQIALVSDLASFGDALPRSPWAEPPREAIALPLASPDQASAYGVLICGISPHRVLDAGYRTFLELAAAQVVTAIRNARALEHERKRAEALAEIDRAKTAFFSNVSHEFRTPLTLMLGPTEDALALPDPALRGAERDQLLRRERGARREAEAANRAKDEFLAVVSHELRTPLNAMMGWARLLLDGGLPADRLKHGLEVIERNAQTQAQLIDDLLDVSRIISGKVRIDPRPIRPIEFMEVAIESVRLAASAKGVRLQLALDPEADDILGDRDRLQQVVWNLLSNAIKFTPAGGRVHVRLARAGADVEICVEDTGRGIPAAFMPYVFERFRQADAGLTRALGGLGLGLAIARHLVELHGGTIGVHSDGDGRGARFTVRLPIAGPACAASEPGASAASAPAPRGRTPPPDLGGLEVLVVDDEQDGRDVISEILARAHARVTVAASAAEAMDVLARLRPAVLVSDIGMPDEDGFTLMRRVRALPEHRGGRIPAVALTAYARAVDRQQAMLAGYDIHLGKPVDPGELVDVVASLAARDAAVPG